MKNFWHSESNFFNLAGVCIFTAFGAVVTPSIGLHLIFAYEFGALVLVAPLAIGILAFARAVVLQRRRYAQENANSAMWRTN